ncbi:glycosyltransferase [Calothrix sp. 336/3]|uniref:glycosyltransferase n=1 Tax=Calothrix sp. 336/3 TaxID=1337936 RepID=UPI0004E42AF9|nr:glycosyltransferase [Calothrix sp. 336/3]AKG20122.1 glycosyl transferase family 1 [Calothrix sp. 336/3]
MMQQLCVAEEPLYTKSVNTPLAYRVVLVHPSAGVNWSGGAETFAIELSRQLSQYCQIELLSGADCGHFSHPISSLTRTHSYNLLHHPLVKPLWSKFTRFPEIWLEHLTSFLPCLTYLLQNPPDLILPCNEKGGLAIASVVRALKGTPILYTEHGSFLDGGRHLQANLRFQPDKLVVLSDAVEKYVKNLRPQQSTAVIPNGVDLQRFTPDGDRLDFGLSGPIILCVASYLGRAGIKRIELAIEAVSRLPQGSLVVCGRGPDVDYYQALGEKFLGSDRFAIRTFSQKQMPQVYRSADLFTLPSFEEPFGIAYIEAMASGLPVVATDDAMRRYIIGDGGIVCDVTDIDSYSNALQTALSQSWETKPRDNAQRFDWQAIALQYRDVIMETIQRSQIPHPVLSTN